MTRKKKRIPGGGSRNARTKVREGAGGVNAGVVHLVVYLLSA